MSATTNVKNRIEPITFENEMLKALLQIMEAESVSLPSTGRGQAYDVCQYLQNVLGKESRVVTYARSQLSAN